MNPQTTAVLFIEYQNDFVSEGGTQYAAVKPVMDAVGTLANSAALLAGARPAGLCVLHAPIHFAQGYPEVNPAPYGILAGVVASGSFKQGSWGAEISPAMQPLPGEIVIEGKRGLDCFASTNIDFVLRQRGIVDLAIAGFLTNCCVESTMRSAYERGFRVSTMIDCCATLSREEHDVAVTKDFAMFSHPMTHDAFLAKLA